MKILRGWIDKYSFPGIGYVDGIIEHDENNPIFNTKKELLEYSDAATPIRIKITIEAT